MYGSLIYHIATSAAVAAVARVHDTSFIIPPFGNGDARSMPPWTNGAARDCFVGRGTSAPLRLRRAVLKQLLHALEHTGEKSGCTPAPKPPQPYGFIGAVYDGHRNPRTLSFAPAFAGPLFMRFPQSGKIIGPLGMADIIAKLAADRALIPADLVAELKRNLDMLVGKALGRVDTVMRAGAAFEPATIARSVVRDWLRSIRPDDFSLRRTTRAVEGQASREEAARILQEDGDYLFASDRLELRMRAQRGLMTPDFNLSSVTQRVKALREANVPPIFPERFEGTVDGDAFPTIDFILAFVSGNYLRALMKARSKSKIHRVAPASLKDIAFFRTHAFDGAKLSPQILRELLAYVSENDRVQPGGVENAIQLYGAASAFLETALAPMPAGERRYKSFHEGSSLLFIGDRLWHIRYSPEDRERIAREFERKRNKGKGKTANPQSINSMATLFPEIVKP